MSPDEILCQMCLSCAGFSHKSRSYVGFIGELSGDTSTGWLPGSAAALSAFGDAVTSAPAAAASPAALPPEAAAASPAALSTEIAPLAAASASAGAPAVMCTDDIASVKLPPSAAAAAASVCRAAAARSPAAVPTAAGMEAAAGCESPFAAAGAAADEALAAAGLPCLADLPALAGFAACDRGKRSQSSIVEVRTSDIPQNVLDASSPTCPIRVAGPPSAPAAC